MYNSHIPLFEHPDVVTVLADTPLSTPETEHHDYLATHVSGDVLYVYDEPTGLGEVIDVLPGVTSLTTRQNTISVKSHHDFADYPLNLPDDATYDSIVYRKTTAGMFVRRMDFQRLTPYLAPGGQLLAKTKWFPRSYELSLDEIVIADPKPFELPSVYVHCTKAKTQLDAFSDGSGISTGTNERHAGIPDTGIDSQFTIEQPARSYSPSWAWHDPLRSAIEQRFADDRVANICCGTNPVGDVRVDIATSSASGSESYQIAANCLGDGRDLPIQDNAFDVTITDPPWKIPRQERIAFFSEVVRITAPGGTVLVNGWWLPAHPYAKLETVRPTTANQNEGDLKQFGGLSFISEYRVHEQPELGIGSYQLAAHVDDVGLDAVLATMADPFTPRQCAEPLADPRMLASECQMCGTTGLEPMELRGNPLYICPDCGFRNRPSDIYNRSDGEDAPTQPVLNAGEQEVDHVVDNTHSGSADQSGIA